MLSLTSLFVAAGLLLTQSSATPVEVSVGSTKFVGDYNATTGVDAFLGVKYATSSRFERSNLVSYTTSQTLDATVNAPACAQINNATGYATYGVSEDCLYLQIYRPHGVTSSSKVPVLIWVHGGGGTYGSANNHPGYNFVKQSQAINKPVILITINYRLAVWGLIAGKEAVANNAQNLALYDQRNALKWVNKYITNFGGDSAKVTFWGFSAGSMSVHHHFLTTESSSLFRAAILQSGTVASVPALPPANYQASYDAIVAAVGCNTSSDTFACLKTVAFDKLQVAVNAVVANVATYSTRPWSYVIDGDIIPDYPSKLVAQGKFAKKPFISGDVLDEGTLSPKPTPIETQDAIVTFLKNDYLNKGATFPTSNQATLDKIFELYPADPAVGSPYNTGTETFGFGAQFKRAAALVGDLRYHGPRRNWLNDALKYGAKAYSYQFAQATPIGLPAAYGVPHSIDTNYALLVIPPTLTDYYNLALQLHSYWVTFAYNLDPNQSGKPNWPTYGSPNGNLLQFTAASTSVIPDTFRQEAISYINSIPEQFGAPRA